MGAATLLNTDALRLNSAASSRVMYMCWCANVLLLGSNIKTTETLGKHDVLASVSHDMLPGKRASWGDNGQYAEYTSVTLD